MAKRKRIINRRLAEKVRRKTQSAIDKNSKFINGFNVFFQSGQRVAVHIGDRYVVVSAMHELTKLTPEVMMVYESVRKAAKGKRRVRISVW